MLRQNYKCGKCGYDGLVLFEEDAGVWFVFQWILKDHKESMPCCEGNRYDIRLLADDEGSYHDEVKE